MAPGATTLRLKEAINEGTESELREKIRGLRGTTIEFDASKVMRINSLGMRDFSRLIEEASRHNSIKFLSCSPIFVDFLVLVPSVAKSARIESILLDFLCEDCDQRQTREVAASAVAAGKIDHPQCKKCKTSMTPEADLEVVKTVIQSSIKPPA